MSAEGRGVPVHRFPSHKHKLQQPRHHHPQPVHSHAQAKADGKDAPPSPSAQPAGLVPPVHSEPAGYVDSAMDAKPKVASPTHATASAAAAAGGQSRPWNAPRHHPRHQMHPIHPMHPMYLPHGVPVRPPPARPPMYVVGGVPRPRGPPRPPPVVLSAKHVPSGAYARVPGLVARGAFKKPPAGVVPSPRGPPPPRWLPPHAIAGPGGVAPMPRIAPMKPVIPSEATASVPPRDGSGAHEGHISVAEKDGGIEIGPENPMQHLFDEWYACWDAEVEAVYYYNNLTGEASWIHPQDQHDDESSLTIL